MRTMHRPLTNAADQASHAFVRLQPPKHARQQLLDQLLTAIAYVTLHMYKS